MLGMVGAGWHNSSALRMSGDITIVTLSTYTSELNPVGII